jgi:glycosyltransferase involved in cell wall biosynthesis
MQHVWFNNKEIPVIIAVGKLKPQKDFETLIKAFAKVRTKFKARLIILGEGPMLSDLNLLVEKLNITDDVIFEGFVQNPFKYMRNADLFVLSSKYEGLPGVLVQALACGCPVVSTDCPSGPREILENGRYGPLVPVADENALATAIIAQLQTRHDRDYLQTRGRSFSEEEAVRGYLRVLLGN